MTNRIFLIMFFASFLIANLNAQVLFHKRLNDPSNTYILASPNQNGVMLLGVDGYFTSFVQADNNADTLQVKNYSNNAYVSAYRSLPIFHNDLGIDFFQWDTTYMYMARTTNFSIDSTKRYTYNHLLFNADSSGFKFGVALTNNKIAVVGMTQIPSTTLDRAAVVTVFDSALNVLWSNHYYVSGYYLTPEALIEMSGSYVLVGNCLIIGQFLTTNKIFALRIDKTSGNLIGQAEIYDAMNGAGEMVFTAAGNKYLSGSYMDMSGAAPTKGLVIKLNIASTPIFQWAKTIDVTGFPFTDIKFVYADSDGKTYIGGKAGKLNQMGGWSDAHYFVSRADSTISSFDWGKIYSDTLFSGELEDLGCAYLYKDLGSYLLTAGDFSNAPGLAYFINIDKNNGHSSCKNISVQAQSTNLATVSITSAVTISSNVFTYADTVIKASDLPEPHLIGKSITICQQNVGVDEIENKENDCVYPNPTSGLINIKLNSMAAMNSDLTIYNSMGQVVGFYKLHSDNMQLDLSVYCKGLYFYRIKSKENSIINGRFVKQ